MSSNRKKILWLASWYPNKYDPFDGDFIQRHARAAALNNDVHLVFVKEAEGEGGAEEEWLTTGTLTEQLIYFKKRHGLFGKLQKQYTWRTLFLKAVEAYIAKNGRPHLVHVHVPWKAGLIAMAVKKKYGLNYMATEHWDVYNTVLPVNFGTLPYYVRKAIKEVFSKADLLITPSKFLGEVIKQSVAPVSYTVIPNVVDTGVFYPEEDKHSTFTFIHVSNMVAKKNTGGIIRAFQQLVKERGIATVQLVLVGNKTDEYKDLARGLGIEAYTHFKGELPYPEVARQMRSSHCFVLNSFMENSPCVIGEALCCGLPLITTDVGGIAELVDDSNSLFVKENDDSGLAGAMETMYRQYGRYHREQIAESAQKKFGYPNISALHDAVYNRC